MLYNIDTFASCYKSKKNSLSVFLNQMNRKAKTLNMYNSFFANPHGLSNTSNQSSAEDMAKLCAHCLQSDLFRKIINTKTYKAEYQLVELQQQPGEDGTDQQIVEIRNSYHLEWENTNKLLWEGWSGIKTGITPNAGPCLAASFNKWISGCEYCFVVILIKSVSMEARWKEAKQLVQWVITEGIY